jgi:hypothetical protein
MPNASVLTLSHSARLAVQIEGKYGLNPPRRSGTAGQGREVEPAERDEGSQG